MRYEVRDVVGYEGLYEVDNQGNVFSLNYKNTDCKAKRKVCISKQGYLVVNLSKNGKVKSHRVHRLVAEAFIENPMNLPQVNHKDEDKKNNCVENLEFCDQLYNNHYSGCTEKAIAAVKRKQSWKKGQQISAKVRSKAVLQYRKDKEFVAEYPSIQEASRQTGIANESISKCCLGKIKSCGGYVWEYK